MLPPGHIAAGFLSAQAAAIFIPGLNDPKYLLLSALFGFAPDLDFFIIFAKVKKFISSDAVNHRKFITHAPLLYLLLFAVCYLLFPAQWLLALTFLLGTWSHFLLDSVSSSGIAWLWPFSKNLYGFGLDKKIIVINQTFFRHWIEFLQKYSRIFSFKAEMTLVLLALLILFTIH